MESPGKERLDLEAWEQIGAPADSVVRKAGQSISARTEQDNASAPRDNKQAAER